MHVVHARCTSRNTNKADENGKWEPIQSFMLSLAQLANRAILLMTMPRYKTSCLSAGKNPKVTQQGTRYSSASCRKSDKGAFPVIYLRTIRKKCYLELRLSIRWRIFFHCPRWNKLNLGDPPLHAFLRLFLPKTSSIRETELPNLPV